MTENIIIKYNNMTRFLGIIPARYASSRFPGKPLVDIFGKPMIQWVYEHAVSELKYVIVATDDKRILETVQAFGGNAILTSEDHQSGTDRCFEALEKFQDFTGELFDVVINIQGDEPFVKPEQLQLLKGCFIDESVDIATLIKHIDDEKVVFDSNRPKVVINKNFEALYFSRSTIPYIRGKEETDWFKNYKFYQHIGMYAYRTNVLAEITKLPTGKLEAAESLEQLRWLENGYKIKTALTEHESFGVDTPEDLETIKRNKYL